MRAQSLDELRSRLLFHNSMDVWMAYCREKGWKWHDSEKYTAFIEYLRSQNIRLDAPMVRHAAKGSEESPLPTYNMKLDPATVQKIRSFTG